MGAKTSSLTRYVPRVLAEWDSVAPNSLWRELDATLGFFDISGFTPLSERLARKGRIGAEQLTEVLDLVFSIPADLNPNRMTLGAGRPAVKIGTITPNQLAN